MKPASGPNVVSNRSLTVNFPTVTPLFPIAAGPRLFNQPRNFDADASIVSNQTPQDLNLERYKKEARLGCSHAQFHLGLKYELGEGVNQDLAEAFQWYEKAAFS